MFSTHGRSKRRHFDSFAPSSPFLTSSIHQFRSPSFSVASLSVLSFAATDQPQSRSTSTAGLFEQAHFSISNASGNSCLCPSRSGIHFLETMERFKASLKAATLTKEQFRRRMLGSKPQWIDRIDPIDSTASISIAGTDTFLKSHSFRCPADCPRIARHWTDRSLPRIVRSNHYLHNRQSPLVYHTFDNRFGRFSE